MFLLYNKCTNIILCPDDFQSRIFKPYSIYGDLRYGVPKDNMLRQINKLVDFSLVLEESDHSYCLYNCGKAMPRFACSKNLLLKSTLDLSDIDVVHRSRYDVSIKYFLDIAPESSVIYSISFTQFRKLSLQDVRLLDILIQKTVEIAWKRAHYYCEEVISVF